jgi:hypothetical protein
MTAVSGLDLQNFIPPLKDIGIKNLVGTTQRGLSVQFALHTIAAGPALALTFSGLGLTDMADANYAVYAFNMTAAARDGACDAASRATDGFTLLAGNAADEIGIVVVGRIAGQPESTV